MKPQIYLSRKKDGSMNNPKNIELFLKKNGVNPKEFTRADLIHGSRVEEVKKEEIGSVITDADGLIATTPTYLGVTVADCLPIYFWSKDMIGILHGGWRGLKKGIIESAVEKIKRKAITLKGVKVWIGPSIHSCHYEVKTDLVEYFSDHGNSFECRNGKTYLNLQKVAEEKLNSFGIKNITISSECTYCNKKYFSYRRDKKLKNMLAIIGFNY